jgi:hypothetical protein
MNIDDPCPTNFELIQGGLYRETSFGPVRIVAAPESQPPFKVKAMVFEEDTWLVMSAAPTICEPEVHPLRMMTDAMNAEPEPVGSVLVKKGDPLRLLAIVHDVNQEPTWNETWITRALGGVFRAAELNKIPSMGLPLLGTKHGRLEKDRCVVLLARALKQTDTHHLRQIWLIVPPESGAEITKQLEIELASG